MRRRIVKILLAQMYDARIFSNALRWVYTSDAVKRFAALSRASEMRVKALAAYLFILPTPASARVNARQKAWLGARCYTVQQC